MWFQMNAAPGDPTFNMVDSWRITGPLDIDALRLAVATIANRHDILRSRFSDVSGTPARVIAEGSVALDVAVLDSAEDEISSSIEAEISRPFDLTREPPLRCRLLVVAPHDHVLIITIHHIVCDNRSLSIFYRELGELYQNRESSLPAAASRYADYVTREQDAITRKLYEKELGYWRDSLAMSATLVDLPLDRPHRGAPSFKTARVSEVVPAHISQQAASLARQERVPRFVVYLAAYAIMLRRSGSQSDFIIGIAISDRSITERNTIGLFLNTLPLRIDLSGTPSFSDVIQRLRSAFSDVYAYAKVPVNLIIDAIKPARSPGRNPLFQLTFAHENPEEAACALDGATVTRMPLDHHSVPAAFDLGIFIESAGLATETAVRLHYSPDVFNESTIRQMVRSYVDCLASGTADVLAPVRLAPSSGLARPDPPPRRQQPRPAVSTVEATGTERTIAAIWQSVLECEPLDPDDDFFDSGGNSLLALKVVNRVEQSLGLRLNVSTLFDARSIQDLAAVVDAELCRRGAGASSAGDGFEVGTL
jgi:acyl carrier protein